MSTKKVILLMVVGAVLLAAAIAVGTRLGSPSDPEPRRLAEAIEGAMTGMRGARTGEQEDDAESATLVVTKNAVVNGVRMVHKFRETFGSFPRDQNDFQIRSGWTLPLDGAGKSTILDTFEGGFLVCGTTPPSDQPEPGEGKLCANRNEVLAWIYE